MHVKNQARRSNARIWVYSYPANVVRQTATIFDFAHVLLDRVRDVRLGHEVCELSEREKIHIADCG